MARKETVESSLDTLGAYGQWERTDEDKGIVGVCMREREIESPLLVASSATHTPRWSTVTLTETGMQNSRMFSPVRERRQQVLSR